MFFWSAEANTSTGAPAMIWVASVEDPSYVIGLTVTPGFSASNASLMVANAPLSDAAAKTVSSPLAVLVAVALGVGDAVGLAAVPEHAVSASTAARTVAARTGIGRRVIATRSSRSR